MKDYQGELNKIIQEYYQLGDIIHDLYKYADYPNNIKCDLLKELVNEKLEQESRKDKLIVGSEWECIAENRGKNTVFKKGMQVYVWEVEANFITFGHGTVYGYVRDSIPIEQFLLCFKFLKEGEQL